MKSDIELHQRMWRGDAEQPALPGEKSKGLLVVFTGNGKGKSTAAFGMGLRTVAQKKRLGVVQFLGGSTSSAEYLSLGNHSLCDFKIFGTDCSWQSKDRNLDMGNVAAAWAEAKRMIEDPSYSMVILDEVNLLLKHQYLNLDALIRVLRHRRPDLHVVLTGRYAPFELIDFADLVTEMRPMKHPFPAQKVAAQAGVEF